MSLVTSTSFPIGTSLLGKLPWFIFAARRYSDVWEFLASVAGSGRSYYSI